MIKLTAIAAALALSASVQADQAGEWTVHTVSAHVGVSGLNNINPGIGYNVSEYIRLGALYNSYKKPSAYAVGFYDLHPRFRVGAGLISGYTFEPGTFQVTGKTAGIVPLIAAEVDITKHVSVVWFGQAFNLEVKF
jgi:hypothetical protein